MDSYLMTKYRICGYYGGAHKNDCKECNDRGNQEVIKSSPDEYGWLVEGTDNGRAVWLCIVDGHMMWSVESNLAVRFSRVEDGAAMARFLCNNLPGQSIGGLKITDHIWSEK